MNYVRTFFKALSMTLPGEAITPQATRYPNLSTWLKIAQDKLQNVDAALAKANMDDTAQAAISLNLDGRPWSMSLILSSIDFHLSTEFPSLLHSTIEHNLTTLYALHFDDKYRISKLVEVDTLPTTVKIALEDFAEHFMNIPSSTNP